jgi:hypothetical protein
MSGLLPPWLVYFLGKILVEKIFVEESSGRIRFPLLVDGTSLQALQPGRSLPCLE